MKYAFYDKWAVEFMRRLIADFGISIMDAAAIIGNSGHESGGFKSLQEIKPVVKGSRGGYGIMQWTGPRRRAYEAYCERNGLNPADMNTNYAFLFVELKGAEGKSGKVIQRVAAAQTLEKKVEVFMREFLRPGIPHLESRIVWAYRALDAWKRAVNAQPSPPHNAPLPFPKPAPKPAPVKKTWWQRFVEFFLGE